MFHVKPIDPRLLRYWVFRKRIGTQHIADAH
jgi:hypothetical protein